MGFNGHTNVTIGVPIKIALMRARLFQRQAAEQLGIPLSSFSMKLLGRRKWKDHERERLAEILNHPQGELFQEYDISQCATDTQETTSNKGNDNGQPISSPSQPEQEERTA